jgi:hypothetical protein
MAGAAGGGKFIQALTGVAKVIGQGRGKKKKKKLDQSSGPVAKIAGAVGKIVKQREEEQKKKIAEAKKGFRKQTRLKLDQKRGGGARRGFTG